MKTNAHTFLAITAGLAVTLASIAAHADKRKGPLEGQPAVRHRLKLVDKRFELAPTFESSINADFRHTVSGGLKAEFHLTDFLSFGAMGYFGKSFNTGLTNKIIDSLEGEDRPTPAQFEQHLNSIPLHGAAYVSWTPWYGKMAAFGTAFIAFDFYFSGGLTYVQLKENCDEVQVCTDDDPDGNTDADPTDPNSGYVAPDYNPANDLALNGGTTLGLYVGGGMHLFLNEWLALDISFRDYMFSDNPSGLDFDADLMVTEDDKRFLNHFYAGIGISVFLPARAKRTN